MNRKYNLISVVILSLLLSNVVLADESSSEKFKQLLADHWNKANEEQIFFRSDPDAYRMNGKLASFSKESVNRRDKFNQSVLSRLKNIDLAQLSDADQVTYRLFLYERQTEAKSYQQLEIYFPIDFLSGYDTYFAGAPGNMSFLTKKNYDDYLISLADFPRYNQEHISNLTDAIKLGYTQYCESFKNYHLGIKKNIVADVEKSAFYQPLKNIPARFSDADKRYYQSQTKKLIKSSIIPEYQKFYDFFTQQYMPNCRTKVSVSSLNKGAEYYQYLIEYFTTTSMTADEIHTLGLKEVARIRKEMQDIIKQVGFKGTYKDFIQFLRTDDQFYTDSERDLIEKASYITRKMAAQLPKWFSVLPRGTFDIKPVPNNSAYYVGSDGSGTTSGTYFLGTEDLRAMGLYQLESLTFHEAEPGHHFQSSIAQEVDMAEFRKTLYHAAYGEGWGLYSEKLGKEIGFYKDPYSDFGRLSYEAWRAARLVVDTGLHSKDWSRQKAIDYLSANTALSMKEVENQIDRYITWPAQALSYKIGELKIWELRHLAEKKLGDKFDIRTFHTQILKNGSLPLALLEELTNDWINQQLDK